jgi:hypothetical protein
VCTISYVIADAGSPLADFSTLKMEAIRFSETSVKARCTQHHIPEDDILNRKLVPTEIPDLDKHSVAL